MVCRASAGLYFLAFASLLLAGCDNTTVAFCSGSDEFCSSFFDHSLSDEDEHEPPDSEPGEVTATQAALTIASVAPDTVTSAIEQQTMAQLTRKQPDLIGLWLIAATLGHLVAPEDVPITKYLDQNRAWITPLTTATENKMMVAGLDLLAAFATHRDPALAELAQNPAKKISQPVVDREAVSAEVQAAIASMPADTCCTTTELAAAAISLCAELPHSEQRVQQSVSLACGVAHHWWATAKE